MNLFEEIKEKRIALGLSQKDFADALGLGKDGLEKVRSWEKGLSCPSLEETNRIYLFAKDRPFMKTENDEFTFIDLFAGIGGIRIPFQELGGKCVFTSEWDKFAQKTYSVNFGEMPAGDITKIEADEIPAFDILLGGFPCQPFSQAGLKKGFADTRGTLFFEIERIMAEKRPKAFLLENVKQLRGHDHGRTLQVILQHLDALDYQVTYKVLRAADYGVPQNRERIYIVGIDRKVFNIGTDYLFPFPAPTHEKTRLGDILEPEVDSKYTISEALWVGHQRRRKEHAAKGNGFGYSLFNAESEYANTISARYYKDGSEILIDKEKETVREC